MPGDAIADLIEGYTPRSVSPSVARFAQAVTHQAVPENAPRAKAFLFAASRLGAFAESVGVECRAEVLLCPSVIERFCHPATTAMSAATRRTVRSNLRAIAARVVPTGAAAPKLSRERAKSPYSSSEIAAYLALADAQPTESRRLRAQALVCLGAGAGLVGSDVKAVRGTDVAVRCGGVVVEVISGRRPRTVPVLSRYHERLVAAARWARGRLLIGGTSPTRHNVTTSLTASLAGGRDLPRLEIARLRATWLCEVAGRIGLGAFMEAAGLTCSQRLGDLVAMLGQLDEPEVVALLGGRS